MAARCDIIVDEQLGRLVDGDAKDEIWLLVLMSAPFGK